MQLFSAFKAKVVAPIPVTFFLMMPYGNCRNTSLNLFYKDLQGIQSVLLGFVRVQMIYDTGDIQHLRIVDYTPYNNAIFFLRIELIAGIVNTFGFNSQRAKY